MIKINNNELEKKTFPDGTPNIQLFPEFKSDAYDQVEITWEFDSMEELFILQCIADYYKGKELFLYMPYIPNARMDRVKNSEDVFTLKSFAKMINSMGFARVVVNNAHSDVSMALIDNIDDVGLLLIKEFLRSAPSEIETIMFPDAGACKRYSSLEVVKQNYNIVIGQKNRDWKTGTILGLDIIGKEEDIKDKDVLIIDDICSKGGTFKYSAIELKKRGAKNIYLYISHCENVIDIEALKEAGITKVFTTNSIYRGTNDFVEVC